VRSIREIVTKEAFEMRSIILLGLSLSLGMVACGGAPADPVQTAEDDQAWDEPDAAPDTPQCNDWDCDQSMCTCDGQVAMCVNQYFCGCVYVQPPGPCR
jgi:hypothetical protein